MEFAFDISTLRYLAIISVGIYFIYEYFDGKVVKDEREELVRLKTYEFTQKLTIGMLTVVTLFIVFVPEIPAVVPVLALVFPFLYGEIFGKIYFRRKL